jgi:pimeloyl-ACP methyl ester carboxylesterase
LVDCLRTRIRWLSATATCKPSSETFFRAPPFVCLPCRRDRPEVDPSDGSRVLCHCHWQPEPERSHRVSRWCWCMVWRALRTPATCRALPCAPSPRACNVIRMNMRNCGGSESAHAHALPLRPLHGRGRRRASLCRAASPWSRVALVGYSMGGNLVLKLAGEWGSAALRSAAVAVVCPAIDLAAGADALHETRQPRVRVALPARADVERYAAQSGACFLASMLPDGPSALFAPFASSIRQDRRALLRLP